jgi:hypothetical protein
MVWVLVVLVWVLVQVVKLLGIVGMVEQVPHLLQVVVVDQEENNV